MSHDTRTREPSGAAVAFASVLIRMGGDREYYASPDVLAAGLGELIRGTLRRLSALIAVPPSAQGGFLQPPEGSQFGREG